MGVSTPSSGIAARRAQLSRVACCASHGRKDVRCGCDGGLQVVRHVPGSTHVRAQRPVVLSYLRVHVPSQHVQSYFDLQILVLREVEDLLAQLQLSTRISLSFHLAELNLGFEVQAEQPVFGEFPFLPSFDAVSYFVCIGGVFCTDVDVEPQVFGKVTFA
eukprot:CAMPEP_0113925676 /NCGR_PEP_ID=MMETSP1159-20121227/3323_1 /TAXON_ID=88271 /ORGANISM="Picocystis salinarum" /LENGTH=159 /DNA_ID=CAMNT_0000925967 /DNA_START=286 /DNA_END=765 /DNA_ORIENTATION=- /assembly_acc=CAM_ASM_000767